MAFINADSLINPIRALPGRLRGGMALAAAILLLACVSITSDPARAAEAEPLEYQVKAAFLLNFTKFVQWPASAFADENSPVAICILGEDPFGNTLDEMVRGEAVNGRNSLFRGYGASRNRKRARFYLSAKSEKDVARTLADLGPGVLTVGEGEKFLRDGGIIAFVIQDRRVRFDIDQAAAAKARITLSSRLMNVARSVEK